MVKSAEPDDKSGTHDPAVPSASLANQSAYNAETSILGANARRCSSGDGAVVPFAHCLPSDHHQLYTQPLTLPRMHIHCHAQQRTLR